MELLAAADVGPCTVHASHSPAALTVERHHVVPQAWQATWVPEPQAKARLWDPRTVVLCPTGHRNVHMWIVRLMRAINQQPGEDIDAAIAALRPLGPHRRSEFPTALLALERFQAAGGSLWTLIEAGQWGEA